ncbi:acyl carrier protein [Kribbella antibiotica]|uniref:Acyl carrier protein n=1 Tax=Kribbella antibiotica TaxID=190195 RepID=A0A4R4ZU61_9ACTN|nr:acyl carrier protein [Kribbella antibiotica]TDD61694.1 acyl carrier protein [Kribbella antibiotica]
MAVMERAKVLEVLSIHAMVAAESVADDLSLEELGLDSLALGLTLADLEERFDVVIEPDDLSEVRPETLFGDLIDAIVVAARPRMPLGS